jgi:hypothetical protein
LEQRDFRRAGYNRHLRKRPVGTYDDCKERFGIEYQTACNLVAIARKRVIRMGKQLARMQKKQKKDQSETDQTWKEWCEATKKSLGDFPSPTNCVQYTLIAKYPGAYRKDMSIREALSRSQIAA